MGKRYSYDSLDQIPEGDRALYVERGGKYVLDIEDGPDTAETERLRKHADKLLADLRKAKESGTLTAEDKALLEQLKTEKEEREAAELIRKGEFEKRLQQVQAAEAKKATAAEEKAAAYRKRLIDSDLRVKAQNAFTKFGGDAEILMPHLERDIDPVENADGSIEFRIREKAGSANPHRFNAKGELMSLDEYVETDLQPRFPRAFDIPAASGSSALGSGAGSAGTKPGKSVDVKTAEAMSLGDYAAARKSGQIK